MNRIKITRVIAIVLIVTLCAGIIPMTPAGEKAYGYSFWPWFDYDDHFNDHFESSEDAEPSDSCVRVNPLYEEEINTEDIEDYENGIVFDYVINTNYFRAATVAYDTTYAETISEAGAVLRSEMTSRSANPVVYYKMGSTIYKDDVIDAVDAIFANAIKHTGKPKEGDSLDYVWKSWGSNIGAIIRGDSIYLKIQYNIKYYTTASQEAAMDNAVAALKTKLNVDDKSDYAKVKAIYNYICDNVSYDYSNSDGYIRYTAYGALVNGACVCQGYATLFYRLALEYGIDTRVITGTADGKSHAWNIVKLDGKYYYVDATWDSERFTQAYFLKGTNNWAKHTASSKYSTSSFKAAYPVSSSDYVANTLSAPEIEVECVASSGKPKVTWNKVTGATSYEIWRKTGLSGDYTKISTTTSTSMTNTSAEAGTAYSYKVKAIANDGTSSAFSNEETVVCDLAVITNFKITNVASSGLPQLTWDAVEGADKYEVWRRVGTTGEYQLLKRITGTTTTHTTAVAGTTYYYKVKAICASNSEANSAFSGAIIRTCDLAAITNFKITNVASSGLPQLTWDAVEGADKYEVWRRVGTTGEYQLLKTITGTTTTHTTAVAGTTYYYKVKAICASNSEANSAFSGAIIRTCDLEQVTNLKVTKIASSGLPQLTWDAVEGADKYEVWRRVGTTGEYQLLKTITGTTTTHTTAVAGTTYYYKVKAICASNSEANSAFSKEAYIKL